MSQPGEQVSLLEGPGPRTAPQGQELGGKALASPPVGNPLHHPKCASTDTGIRQRTEDILDNWDTAKGSVSLHSCRLTADLGNRIHQKSLYLPPYLLMDVIHREQLPPLPKLHLPLLRLQWTCRKEDHGHAVTGSPDR